MLFQYTKRVINVWTNISSSSFSTPLVWQAERK